MNRAAMLFVACLCLSGCRKTTIDLPPPPTTATVSLDGTSWTAIEIGGQPLTLDPAARGPKITIDAANKRFSGNAGCNSISGMFTPGPQGIRFTDVIATRLACPALDTETRFLKALNEVASYRIDGGVLELLDNSGTVRVRLRAATA